MAFQASTFFQSWAQRLRIPWLDPIGRGFVGALAKVIGDSTVDWMMYALLERHPEYAASATSVGLIASERQIIVGPAETQPALSTRLTGAVQAWQKVGTPLGLLVALYYAGFPGALLVQQNGVAYSLSLPLPALPGDPSPNLVTTQLNGCPFVATSTQPNPSRTLAPLTYAQAPWWTFDSSSLDAGGPSSVQQFTSRFAILFPGPQFPSSLTTYATAVFNGGSTNWVTVTWNNPFPDTTYKILVGPATVTDGGGPVQVFADGILAVNGGTKTTTGVSVRSSAPFTGTVDVLAYQAGQNPFADFHPGDLARLRNVIALWKGGTRTCVGIYCVAQGQMFGWPVQTIGARGKWGPGTVISFSP